MAVLEQVDELMNTGELAGIPSQVRPARLNMVAGFFLFSLVETSCGCDASCIEMC